MKPALPNDWNTKPLPERFSVIALDREFSEEEMPYIKAGLIPQEMEDKWFIYWKDSELYFHRSWTGICLFVARFVREDKTGWRMVEAQANRDQEQYGETSDSRDAQLIFYLIDLLLLRRPASYPSRSNDPAERTMANWAMVGRAMLGQGPKPGDRPNKRPDPRPPQPPTDCPERA